MFLFAIETAAEAGFYEQLVAIFENNLINWLVLVGLLIWLWNTKTPPMFAARKERLEGALRDAAAARAEGEKFLQEQRTNVAKAEQEASKILSDAKVLAEQMKTQLEEQTKKDVADLEKRITGQLANERQLAITELRTAAAKASIKLAEETLPKLMNEQTKAQLLTQFMEQLDAATAQESGMPTGHLEKIR